MVSLLDSALSNSRNFQWRRFSFNVRGLHDSPISKYRTEVPLHDYSLKLPRTFFFYTDLYSAYNYRLVTFIGVVKRTKIKYYSGRVAQAFLTFKRDIQSTVLALASAEI